MSSIWNGSCFATSFSFFLVHFSFRSMFVKDTKTIDLCSCALCWQEFNPDPIIPIYMARPDQVEKALKHVYHSCVNKLKGKELELLLVILPDNNGSLYGMVNITFLCWIEIALKIAAFSNILTPLSCRWHKADMWDWSRFNNPMLSDKACIQDQQTIFGKCILEDQRQGVSEFASYL